MHSSLQALRQDEPVVLPSLLLCDFGNLAGEVGQLDEAGVLGYHLDVMDGQFVPNLTYGLPIVEAMRRLTDRPLDVHLMVDRPERYLKQFREAGADILTVHVEACPDPVAVLREIRDLGAAAGIAINPSTPMERIQPCLNDCDLVLVMSVEAGFGGQSFHPEALERLAWVRERVSPDVVLEIDGGINVETIGPSVEAGAELLVVGSAIFRQPNYAEALTKLLGVVRT